MRLAIRCTLIYDASRPSEGTQTAVDGRRRFHKALRRQQPSLPFWSPSCKPCTSCRSRPAHHRAQDAIASVYSPVLRSAHPLKDHQREEPPVTSARASAVVRSFAFQQSTHHRRLPARVLAHTPRRPRRLVRGCLGPLERVLTGGAAGGWSGGGGLFGRPLVDLGRLGRGLRDEVSLGDRRSIRALLLTAFRGGGTTTLGSSVNPSESRQPAVNPRKAFQSRPPARRRTVVAEADRNLAARRLADLARGAHRVGTPGRLGLVDGRSARSRGRCGREQTNRRQSALVAW